MKIQIYDCPKWVDKYERGKLLSEFIDTEEILKCTSIKIHGEYRAIFTKVYNRDESLIEIWVKGEIKVGNNL